MIRGLHHVQITVPIKGVEKARRFYLETLALPEMAKPAALLKNGGFWMRLGPVQVHVGLEDRIRRHRTKAHLCYAVADAASLRRRLEGFGVETTELSGGPLGTRFECRDPFGNRIEFLQG
jgi:catechol 2,3-dioxygenase-like lactoylglutathione lyase family enzyme